MRIYILSEWEECIAYLIIIWIEFQSHEEGRAKRRDQEGCWGGGNSGCRYALENSDYSGAPEDKFFNEVVEVLQESLIDP